MSATEKATLEARIDELCAENERLRERLKASEDGRMRQADNLIDKYYKIACLQTEYASLRDENERLRSVVSDGADNAREIMAENAKLRELCGFMLRCMKRNHDCDCCLVNGEHCEISYIESDARELGVE